MTPPRESLREDLGWLKGQTPTPAHPSHPPGGDQLSGTGPATGLGGGGEGWGRQPSKQDLRPQGWTLGFPGSPGRLESPHARRDKGPGPGEERQRGHGASGPDELLDHVAGEAVEEEGKHKQPQQRQHDLDDEPLVPRADEVLDGLEGVEEPDKGGVRPAGGEEGVWSGNGPLPGHPMPLALQDPQHALSQPGFQK